MRRRVRYHDAFRGDLAAIVGWLATHRPPEHRERLRVALANFVDRIGTHPWIGEEVERRGSRSYRVFPLEARLPYLVWYTVEAADERAPISFLMLLHESQDRRRFSPDELE